MAGDSRWYRAEEESQQREKAPRLSTLQQSILYWLRHEVRRRQRTGDALQIPYPELVSAMHADKMAVTNDIRRLLRKGLVDISLPPGSWVRYVMLTEKGTAQTKRDTGATGRRHEYEEERRIPGAFSRRRKR